MAEAKGPKGGRRPVSGEQGGRPSSQGAGRKVGRGRTPPTPEVAAHEISVAERPMGRDTLMDLQDELRAAPWPRAPLPTVGYHEVPLDRGDARAGAMPPEPRALPAIQAFDPRNTLSPEIEVSLTEISLRALTMLDGSSRLDDEPADAGAPAPDEAPRPARPRVDGDHANARRAHADRPFDAEAAARPSAAPAGPGRAGKWVAGQPFEAFELRSFVVPPSALGPRAGNEQRLELIRTRFADRLPCPVERVRRVDARVVEAGALMLIVWCPVEG